MKKERLASPPARLLPTQAVQAVALATHDRIRHVQASASHALIALLTMLMTASACAFGTIEGQVLDEDTNQPIPGAIVFATWYATSSGFPDSHTYCLHVETATADATGHYVMADWHGWWLPNNWLMFDRTLYMGAYKARYDLPRKGHSIVGKLYLKPFKGTMEEWIEHRDIGGFSCSIGVDDSVKNLYRVWATLVADEAPFAETREQLDTLRLHKAIAARLLVNHEKPVTSNSMGFEMNVDPNDSFKPEELTK